MDEVRVRPRPVRTISRCSRGAPGVPLDRGSRSERLVVSLVAWCNERMEVGQDHSLADKSRSWRVVLAAAGAVWAALTLPLPATVWGVRSYEWVFDLDVYVWARGWVGHPYIVFGALASVSFLAIGLALLPDLRRAGWGGSLMAWLTICGAPVTVVSYTNTSSNAPLHFMWGWSFYVLVAVGIAGIIAAITAGSRWGFGARTLLGMTLVFLVVGTLTLVYYPHGSLVILGLEAVAVILSAPRDRAFATDPADDSSGARIAE